MTMTSATTTIITTITAVLIRELLCQKYCRNTLQPFCCQTNSLEFTAWSRAWSSCWLQKI